MAALMVTAGAGLVRESGQIFQEAAPAGLSPDAIGDLMARLGQVVEVHDLHIWLITSGEPALSAHVLVAPGGDCHHIQHQLGEQLRYRPAITHATLQVDHLREDDSAQVLHIGTRPADHPPSQPDPEDTHGPVHRPGPHEH